MKIKKPIIKGKAKTSKFKQSKLKKPLKPNKKKNNFGKMSIDEFMNNDFGSEDEVNVEQVTESKEDIKVEDTKQDELWGDNKEDLDEGNSDKFENEIISHKASLDKLKNTDPEFYKFLQENDKKLLEFNISDSEDEEETDVNDQRLHKPGELEIASDESDYEDEDDEKLEDGSQKVITLKMIKNWEVALKTDKTNKTIGCVVQAFHAALLRVANNEDEIAEYRVDGSSIFNAVIQLCVLELSPAIRRFLGLTSSKMAPHKCKKFVKVKSILKSYFTDLLRLLGGVTSTNILTVLLKHLHQMSILFVSFPNIAKPMIKKLIHLWGSGEDVVRVLAFFCIIRITNNQLNLLETVLKSMYMTYVINSKFVSVNTLSSINFMRRSLVEIFALDPGVSYQHVFLYIRQLGIHLRNAITVHKKENIQTVYNWQFINSLKLWGNLLAATYDKPQLQSLVYPFVQVCLGTMKLVPTTQYFPLRFQVIRIIIDFSKSTDVFIPILPFILEVLSYDFSKKHKKVSMKPIDFTCLLRASTSQISENGFKDSLIDLTYSLLLEYLASQSHLIAFPDLSLFCIIHLKQFLNKCTIANYTKKFKQILEKIKQNNDFIEKERKNIDFKLTDSDKIQAFETQIKNKGTPLITFYESWNKVRTIKKNKEATNADKLGDYNLPTIKRVKRDVKVKEGNKAVELFPSDSESDLNVDGKEDNSKKKQNKKKRRKRARKEIEEVIIDNDDGQQDTIEDININDW